MENSERDGNTRPPNLPLEKSVYRSGSKLERDMKQQTDSKWEKSHLYKRMTPNTDVEDLTELDNSHFGTLKEKTT